MGGHSEIPSLIMSGCDKRRGAGLVFFRRDGLESTPERVALRAEYLQQHLDIKPEYRQAIERAGVTHGMTRWDLIAAWGLLAEDMKTVGGRRTADTYNSYEWWGGFRIGQHYALDIVNDEVVGIVCEHGTPITEPLASLTEPTDESSAQQPSEPSV
jgi:hypothetical protein